MSEERKDIRTGRQMIVITKDCLEGGCEIPKVYRVGGDDRCGERASAILGTLYRDHLEEEKKESTIPVDHECTLCDEDEGYAQIVWTNGDIQRYFLTSARDIPGFGDNGGQEGRKC